jgi:hypothetical protein
MRAPNNRMRTKIQYFHGTPQIIMVFEITKRVQVENVFDFYILEFQI